MSQDLCPGCWELTNKTEVVNVESVALGVERGAKGVIHE
jgi:hypothetical protein